MRLLRWWSKASQASRRAGSYRHGPCTIDALQRPRRVRHARVSSRYHVIITPIAQPSLDLATYLQFSCQIQLQKRVLSIQSSKVPRSRSSPSPPASRSDRRTKHGHGGQRFRRRLGSVTANEERGKGARESAVVQGWSTSYQAGSSRCVICKYCWTQSDAQCSSESMESSDDSDSDTDTGTGRGRSFSQSGRAKNEGDTPKSSSFIRRRSPDGDEASSGESSTTGVHSVMARTRKTFTRSRSPVVTRKSQPSLMRHYSPTSSRPARRHPLLIPISLLPASIAFQIPNIWIFSVDTRKLGEFILLLASLLYATSYLSPLDIPLSNIQSIDDWQALGTRPESDITCFLSHSCDRASHPRIAFNIIFPLGT